MSEYLHPVYELAEYVAANEPDSPQYRQVRAHLARCGSCRSLQRRLHQTETALHTLPVVKVDPVFQQQLANIAAGHRPKPPEWRLVPWTVWVPAAAVITASLALLLLFPSETLILRDSIIFDEFLLKPEAWNNWLETFRMSFTHGTLVTVGSAAAAILGGAGFVWALTSLSPEQHARLDDLGGKVSESAAQLLHIRRSS